ncbi:MAG: hypothetical protein KKE73_08530 [Proteobacteria bacterium]|nr:hypothetical protein [Pseudomonadota bacterium]
MLIRDKKHFRLGLAMAIGFMVVFAYMFMPSFEGGLNAFEAADKMFNSIAKGSTLYIPELQEQAKAFDGKGIEFTVLESSPELARRAELMFTANSLSCTLGDAGLTINEDLGAIIRASLRDSQSMFDNNGSVLADRYGMPEKEAMFVWWKLYQSMDTALKTQKRFKDAKFLSTVVAKGVEVGYNFYKVEPESASSKMGMLTFSLVFYVVYTLWWGYAIFFLFEGFGLAMKAGAKKEV